MAAKRRSAAPVERPSASGEAVERDLGHHGNDPRVVGRDRDGVRSTEGVAPQRHPVGVEVGTSPDPGDGGSDVLVLTRDVDELAWLAAALTEAAVIEDERGDPAGGGPFGMGDQPVHRSAEPMGEDDRRQACVGTGSRFREEQVTGNRRGA